LEEALDLAKDYDKGPITIRIPRANKFEIPNKKALEFGKWNVIREGKGTLIIATGSMVEEILKVENSLKELNPTIVAAPFINPLDKEFLLAEVPKYEKVFTVEEGIIKSGFGTSVLEFLNDNDINKKVKRIGLAHKFIEHGTRDELLAEYGLRGESLVKTILEGR